MFKGGDTNLCGDVMNDLVNLIDPSGSCSWCIGAAVGGISAGAVADLCGGSARDVVVAAGIGALVGAASMGVSVFTTTATGIIAVNAAIGGAANAAIFSRLIFQR
ncbi:hypothetical protein BH10BDE1_BH10BDE1_23670 [soil metagenome]